MRADIMFSVAVGASCRTGCSAGVARAMDAGRVKFTSLLVARRAVHWRGNYIIVRVVRRDAGVATGARVCAVYPSGVQGCVHKQRDHFARAVGFRECVI